MMDRGVKDLIPIDTAFDTDGRAREDGRFRMEMHLNKRFIVGFETLGEAAKTRLEECVRRPPSEVNG